MKCLAAIFGLLAILAPVEPLKAQSEAPKPGKYDGKCEYADRLIPFLSDGYTFWLCDGLSVEQEGSQARIVFLSRNGRTATFTGNWKSQWLAVNHLQLGSDDPLQVDGECKVFRADKGIAAVTCIASRRGRGWAANFVPAED